MCRYVSNRRIAKTANPARTKNFIGPDSSGSAERYEPPDGGPDGANPNDRTRPKPRAQPSESKPETARPVQAACRRRPNHKPAAPGNSPSSRYLPNPHSQPEPESAASKKPPDNPRCRNATAADPVLAP